MCGIFGIVVSRDADLSADRIREITAKLFQLSETRGQEAAGLALRVGDTIEVLKQAGSASNFIRSPRYRELLDRSLAAYADADGGAGHASLSLIGHSRLVTNGFQCDDDNNQPVLVPRMVGVHNGIIVNEARLWARYDELSREYDVDTEVLLKVLRYHLDHGQDPQSAVAQTFSEIEGTASIGVLPSELPVLLLATNTGALFHTGNERQTFFVFASERFILQRLLDTTRLQDELGPCRPVRRIRPQTGVLVRTDAIEVREFPASASASAPAEPDVLAMEPTQPAQIVDRTKRARDLQRCTRCILPESYPMIEFDADGVCNFCRNHVGSTEYGEQALLEAVEPYRSSDGSPDCIVAFSGGRDSSYGLHYIKTVLKMNPVAFTYDWGM
ncbi:MAG TPA: hypothetical protein ENK16_04095, partial [Chromatiales bacterium]|nr:hypothetical protein [Chromatiales bacterium]